MKNLRRTFTVLFAAAFSMQVLAQREDKLINQDWSFRFSHQVNASAARRVDLPHTWNAQDALGGKHDYKRGIGNYTKKIFIRPEWQGKRLFLRFEGANCVSNVFVNGKHIGEHRGGYGAFVFEITDKVEYGKENTLLVRGRKWRASSPWRCRISGGCGVHQSVTPSSLHSCIKVS
jgi:beta-galactosidase